MARVVDGSLHEERNESEERYRTLFDTLIEGFCTIEMIFDAAGKPVDYRFLEINPAFGRQTGLIDAQGKTMRELAPNHEAHWFEIYGKVALTGEAAYFENEAKALGRVYDVCAYRVGGPGSKKVAILFNDISARKLAEEKVLAQLGRLALLDQITRAIGQRQDLASIFQVVVGTLEEEMPVDFGCICTLDALDGIVTVTCVGARSAALAADLGIAEQSRIALDTNGFARCLKGELLHEPDIAELHFPLTEKLVRVGLRALVAASRGDKPFDAVITDLGMPYMDGRKVAEAIKSFSRTTPVILLTGWGQRLIDEGDIPSHVDQVLSKPPKLRQLRETLAQHCVRH